jgi:hypothetical protein
LQILDLILKVEDRQSPFIEAVIEHEKARNRTNDND